MRAFEVYNTFLFIDFQTIFEIGQNPTSEVYNVMKMKRDKHCLKILKHHEKLDDRLRIKKGKQFDYSLSNF